MRDRGTMTDRARLSPSARDAAVDWLLREHPDAWVSAIGENGLFVPVPDGVAVDGHPVIERVGGTASPLDIVVPEDRVLVIQTWDRAVTEGGANASVRTPTAPEALVGLHFLDETHRYGVYLGLFIGLPPEGTSGIGEQMLVPRTSVIRKDQIAVIIEVDQALSAILGWSEEELVGRRTLDLIHPDDQDSAVANWMDMLAHPGVAHRIRLRHRHRNGSWVWLELTNHNHLTDPVRPCVVAEMVDVTDEVSALDALRASEQLLRRLTDALPVGVFHIGVDRRVSYANERLNAIVGGDGRGGGAGRANTVDERLATVVAVDREALRSAVDRVLHDGRDSDIEASFRPADGALRRCLVSLRALTGPGGEVTGAIVCVSDVTADINLREELADRVRYDPLTHCLNHASVLSALEGRLAAAGPRTWSAAVFIDLDDFKGINDQMGHVAGDRLLRQVARRLHEVADDDALVGRLGGDEFLVVCDSEDSPQRLRALAERIRIALTAPIDLGEVRVTPRASIGLAYVAAGDTNADGLIAMADAAMYESKRLGDGALVVTDRS